jgi:hypothetical protein
MIGATLPGNFRIIAYGEFWSDWDLKMIVFHLSVIFAAGLLLWLGVTAVGRMRESRQRNGRSPQALFLDLCRTHSLSRLERQLLTVVSQSLPGEQCCRIFIDSEVLQHFAREHPADAAGCSQLERRLFGVA